MNTVTLSMSPTQWSSYKDIEDIEPLHDGDLECLAEVSKILSKYNKRSKFGVALLHKHFDMTSDEQLVEFTDAESRVLTIKPVKNLEAGRTIQTIWALGEVTADNKVLLGCSQQCWTNVQGGHSRSHQPNNN